MPTNAKPSLNHKSFDWVRNAKFIDIGLRRVRMDILNHCGFLKEYDDDQYTEKEYNEGDTKTTAEHNAEISSLKWGNLMERHGEKKVRRTVVKKRRRIPLQELPHFDEKLEVHVEDTEEAHELLNEIGGFLCLAASTRIEAGFKPAKHVIATIKAIKRDKSIINYRRFRIEPEALGSIEFAYEKLFHELLPDLVESNKLNYACDAAIAKLKGEQRAGAQVDRASNQLAANLHGVFGRFGTNAARKVTMAPVQSWEDGKFTAFLNFVVPPLNQLMVRFAAKEFSIRSMAELAASIAAGRVTVVKGVVICTKIQPHQMDA